MSGRFLKPILHRITHAAASAAFLLCAPVGAFADDIALTSANGGLTLTGRFIAYDGTYLQIESPYGPLTVRYGDMSCVGADCPDPDAYVPKVRLSGASRMADILLPGLIEGFGRSAGYQVTYTQVDATHALLALQDDDVTLAEFTVRSTSTDEGFADLVAYEADIVMSTREVRKAEVRIADDLGIGRLDDGRQSRIVALDALVPIVAPGRQVSAISMRDLSDLYAGTKDTWPDDREVSLHLMDGTDGLTQAFLDEVLGRDPTPAVTYHATLDDLIGAVVEDQSALGMVPWTKAPFAQQLAITDQCGSRLIPDAEALKAEDYPLTKPLFLYMPDRRQPPIVRAFLSWLRTPEAQLVVRRSGFIDPGAVPISLDAQGQRFANAIALAGAEVPLTELQRMVALMKPKTRLSTTFRFREGSTALDAQSRSALMDLASAIRSGRYDGRRLTLIGFSDGRGSAAANRELALQRAVSMQRALAAALGEVPSTVRIETDAFGEALPMGCDDTVWGRKLNRRVELWVD